MSSTSNAPTSPVKPSSTAKTHINRLPAPTLFVGPPSRNASQLSITRTATIDSNAKPVRDPLTRTKSALRQPFQPISAASVAKDSDLAGGDLNDASYRQQQSQQQQPHQQQLRKPSERSVNTKWRELQNTMNEVELTAQSTTHVFGDSHAAALAELRRAQVELARAWGRGSGVGGAGDDGTTSNSDDNSRGEEEDTSSPLARKADGGPNPSSSSNGLDALGSSGNNNDKNKPPRPRADTNASIATASTALTDESRSTEGGSRGRRSYLEDETALDVKLASERRAANEAYFKQVDQGVREVVAKLEAVAEAMKGMEGETRSLWSEEGEGGLDSPVGAGEGGEGKGEAGE